MKKLITTTLLVASLGASALSAKTIATVNGYPISEKQANNLLKVLTRGKVKYAQLNAKDKKQIVQRLAVDTLVIKSAYKGLSKKERDFVIANAWMSKKIRGVKVSDSEAKKAYNKNKQLFKKKGKVVPFSKVKNLIKIQLRQKKVVDRMMKRAKIKMK